MPAQSSAQIDTRADARPTGAGQGPGDVPWFLRGPADEPPARPVPDPEHFGPDFVARLFSGQTLDNQPTTTAGAGSGEGPKPPIPEPVERAEAAPAVDLPEPERAINPNPERIAPNLSAETSNVLPEPEKSDQPEPKKEIPEPGRQIPEPGRQIPEPKGNDHKTMELENPEPKTPNLTGKSPNPAATITPNRGARFGHLFENPGSVRLGDDDADDWKAADEDIYSADACLWNFETYPDRHGKRRLRRTLRFVKGVGQELGVIDGTTDEQLKSRPGRGRWAKSRTEANDYRPIAFAIADRHRRDKELRRANRCKDKRKSNNDRPNGGKNLPNPQGHSFGPDVPALLM